MAKIFISYRRVDSSSISGRIYDRLVMRFGVRNIFKDVDNIPIGVNFGAYIQDSLRQCAVMLLIIGPRWLTAEAEDGTRRLDDPRDWVRVEIETAFSLGLLVIPVLVEGAGVPAATSLPESLRELAQINSPQVRNDPDFFHDMARLIASLERPLAVQQGGAQTGGQPALPASWPAPAKARSRGPLAAGLAILAVVVLVGALLSSKLPGSTAALNAAATQTAVSRSTPTATAAPGTVTEYPLLTAKASPIGITRGPDGALWFAEGDASMIGRITTGGTIAEFPTRTTKAGPYEIASGPDGALWFTENTAVKIGRITTGGAVTEYPIPTASATPFGIASGSDGALWFTEGAASIIGRITTSGAITQYPTPTPGSYPNRIVSGPEGALWFTEDGAGKIGRITTAGVVTEYSTPTANSGPNGITRGPDGALWFAEADRDKIGRITTSGAIAEYPIPTAGAHANRIASGSDGALWLTVNTAGKIGRITTAGVVTEYPLLTAGAGPTSITSGPDGAVWFSENAVNKIGRIVP